MKIKRLGRVGSPILLALGLLTLSLPQFSQPASPPPPPEFTLPLPAEEAAVWQVFTGVGHTLRLPPGWEARPHWAQGGVRDSASFDFLWMEEGQVVVRVEVLEIVAPATGTAVMEAELVYWQRSGEEHGYQAEEVTVQGHPGWWIQAERMSEGMGLVGTMWANWGERVYRFRLYSRPEVWEESERLLRQMLSTLMVVAVDWGRAPGAPPELPGETVLESGAVVSTVPAGVPYDRDAAYEYAETYWDGTNPTNDDGCYLWYNGSALDCTHHDGDWGVDGAHFVNRAVHAGGRPIPGLWEYEAIRVADLRDWLVSDGWGVVAASEVEIGDVAIMGPFDDPCWAGLVVDAGSDPTLATHSNELWGLASTMWCYHQGVPTYEKTYLHTEVEFATYMPLAVKNYPPMKLHTGIHLGSRQDTWPNSTLQRIDGRLDGSFWPRAVVVQSSQLYFLDRRPPQQDPLCPIAQARVRLNDLYAYLTEAQRNGVIVIIRITPAPGNFEDWEEPSLEHNLLGGTTPAGGNYCWSDSWPDPARQYGYQYFRAVDDVATEMHEIYKLNVNQYGWDPARFFFEPANEPNNEWYMEWKHDPEAQERLRTPNAWTEMDAYFSALYDHAESLDSNISVLTPPMAQGLYAETANLAFCTPMTVSLDGRSGYDFMPNTLTEKNDGYSWHNYWRQGHETWVYEGEICPTSHHVFQYFPQWLQTYITSSGKPAFVTEADLFSPCQDSANPVTDKDAQAPATRESLWRFVSEEQGADYVVAWLLTEFPYSTVDVCPADPNLTDYEEIRWHQAYENDAERQWFGPWWSGAE